MLLRSMMAIPAAKNVVNSNSDKLYKISKALVDDSTSLFQLTDEVENLRRSQQFLFEKYQDIKQRLHSKFEEVKVLQAENQDLKLHLRKVQIVTSKTHSCCPAVPAQLCWSSGSFFPRICNTTSWNWTATNLIQLLRGFDSISFRFLQCPGILALICFSCWNTNNRQIQSTQLSLRKCCGC